MGVINIKNQVVILGLVLLTGLGVFHPIKTEAGDFLETILNIGVNAKSISKRMGRIWGITELNKSYKNIKRTKDDGEDWKLRYPIITLDDKKVEAKINNANLEQAKKLIQSMTPSRGNTGSTYVKQAYYVTYQDDDYVSFFFSTMEMLRAGPHGPWSVAEPTELGRNFAKVYSKKTGELLPLRYFLDISGVDYYRCIKGGIFPLLNNVTGMNEKTMPERYIPNPRSFYLLGKGRMGIIFPGETHTVSEDDTHLATVISPEDIAKYRQAKADGSLNQVVIIPPMGPGD